MKKCPKCGKQVSGSHYCQQAGRQVWANEMDDWSNNICNPANPLHSTIFSTNETTEVFIPPTIDTSSSGIDTSYSSSGGDF